MPRYPSILATFEGMKGYVKKEDYEALQQSYEELKEQMDQLKRQLFASKSERFVAQELPNQLQLELDGGGEVQASEDKPSTETITYDRKKKKSVARHPLPDHLPRKDMIIEPDVDTSTMKCIGEEVTEVLAKRRATVYVIRIIRKKYAKADGSGIIIARMPSRAIEKGLAHESLLADILVSKYVDHLPLYRQAKIFSREGVQIATSTMNDWVNATCQLLEPLYEALKREILSSDYLQADESPIKVLDKKKKGTTHQGYQWVYHGVGLQLVLFDYQKGRGRDGPQKMLKNYSGYLQTDGYSVYDEFEKNPNITLLGCMAHARRYFEKALDNDPHRARYFIEQVQQLYLLERALKEQEADWDKTLEARQNLAVPILNQLKEWLEAQKKEVLPRSTIGKAIHYSLQRWEKLCRYTSHGGLLIDNNKIENQIRPLALGRKNYLFAGSHRGAQNAAILYSLFGSCKLHGMDPYRYLYTILDILPDYPINRISELLPHRVRLEEEKDKV
jgi:transposase